MTPAYLGEKTGLISRQLFAMCSQEASTSFSTDVGELHGAVAFVLVMSKTSLLLVLQWILCWLCRASTDSVSPDHTPTTGLQILPVANFSKCLSFMYALCRTKVHSGSFRKTNGFCGTATKI